MTIDIEPLRKTLGTKIEDEDVVTQAPLKAVIATFDRQEKVPQEGFEIVGLDIAGFNRSSILKNISLPLKLWKSRMRAKEIIIDFKPDAIHLQSEGPLSVRARGT